MFYQSIGRLFLHPSRYSHLAPPGGKFKILAELSARESQKPTFHDYAGPCSSNHTVLMFAEEAGRKRRGLVKADWEAAFPGEPIPKWETFKGALERQKTPGHCSSKYKYVFSHCIYLPYPYSFKSRQPTERGGLSFARF